MKFFKIFTHYFYKYFSAFLLIFMVCVLLFNVAMNNTKQYILRQMQVQVQEGIQSVLFELDNMDLISQMVYESEGFSSLIIYTPDHSQSPNSHTEILFELTNCNQLLSKSSKLVESSPYILVLFNKNDLFLTNYQRNISFSEYWENHMNISFPEQEITDSEQLKEYLFSVYKNNRKFLPTEAIRYSNNGTKVLEKPILYLTDGVLNYNTSSYIFGFFLDTEQIISALLMPDMKQDCFVKIQDVSSGEELLSYGNIPPETEPFGETQFQKESGYYVTRITAPKLSWNITIGFPSSYIQQQMAPARQILDLYLALGLLLVFALSFYFSFTRYWGVQTVFSSFSTADISFVRKKGFNEYNIFSNHIQTLDRTTKDHQEKLKLLEQQNRAIFLEKLLTSYDGSAQELKIFQTLFGKEPEFYCIAMVRILQNLSISDATVLATDLTKLLQEKNISLLGHVHSAFSDELFFMDLSQSRPNNTDQILQIFNEVATCISNEYGCVLHIGISTIGTGLANISRCYEQAKQIIQTQHLNENINLVQAYDIKLYSLGKSLLTPDSLSQLYNALICGTYPSAEKELQHIKKSYERNQCAFSVFRKQFFYSLLNIFHSAMSNLDCPDMELHMPRYNASASCEEMFADFEESAAWICNYILQRKKSHNDALKSQIQQILDQNYQNYDLSALIVSEQVGISEKYLYQYWKEQTGETFSTTLLRIRLDKAKEYLEQTDYSNQKIAELTGFVSVSTFYRNFQKVVGVSPKEYQSMANANYHNR